MITSIFDCFEHEEKGSKTSVLKLTELKKFFDDLIRDKDCMANIEIQECEGVYEFHFTDADYKDEPENIFCKISAEQAKSIITLFDMINSYESNNIFRVYQMRTFLEKENLRFKKAIIETENNLVNLKSIQYRIESCLLSK